MDKQQPQSGQIWEHRNGCQYKVLMIANGKTERPEQYPVTVVYVNLHNHSIWSRPLSDWYRSMTIIEGDI